jgi:hypothetical protein
LKQHYLARMGRGGGGRTKVVPYPVINIISVSPDRRTVILFAAGPNSNSSTQVDVLAVPVAGGPARRVCGTCRAGWSSDGRYFYLEIAPPPRAGNPRGGGRDCNSRS